MNTQGCKTDVVAAPIASGENMAAVMFYNSSMTAGSLPSTNIAASPTTVAKHDPDNPDGCFVNAKKKEHYDIKVANGEGQKLSACHLRRFILLCMDWLPFGCSWY